MRGVKGLEWLFVLLAGAGLFAALAGGSVAPAADARKAERFKVGYASITGNRIALWAAQEMGFFARQGLQPELIFIASSSQGIPALISGEVAIFSGSPETAAMAAVRGSDVVIIASNEPTQYKLMAQPHVMSVHELRGKKIGIDRIGGSSYYATRRMLEKLGLSPETVEYMQIPGGGAQRAAAFRSGVLTAVVSTTERFERMKISYRALADAVEMGIKVIGSSYVTTRSSREQNRETTQRFIRGLVEAGHWAKNPKNREGVLRVFSRNLRTEEASVLDFNYRTYVQPLALFPYTNADDLRANLLDLAEGNPRLRELNIAEFVDNSFIQRVEREMAGRK